MWIGRIFLFGLGITNISGFFMMPIYQRKYIEFQEIKLLLASRFLTYGKNNLRKFIKSLLKSTLRKNNV